MEMARLEGLLAKAFAGQGQVVFVTGEAGSGKSMLIQEFATAALSTHGDLLIAAGNCNAFTGAGDPYLPFRELLQQLTSDMQADATGMLPSSASWRARRVLALTAETLIQNGPGLVGAFVPSTALMAHTSNGTQRQLQELIAQNTGGVSMLNQEQMVEQLTHTLVTLAAQQPLLLIVDDLQWADAASVGLLFHLARRIEHSRILLVGAYRPHDVAQGRGDDRHPLAAVLNELQRYLGNVRIDLDYAAESSGINFVNAVLDRESNRFDGAFRAALYHQTEGHPLFTVELLRGLQERGDVVRDDKDYWVEGTKVDWETMPARIEGIIAERIGRLDDALREVLMVASIEGESFTAEVVARVQGVEVREMVQLLGSDLDRRHQLVRPVGAGQVQGQRLSHYRFRHVLFQQYLYQHLDDHERVYLHEEVGTALEMLYGEEVADLATQLARHFVEAEQSEKAADYLLLAAQRSLQLSAHSETVAYCRHGLARLTTLPNSIVHTRIELDFQLALGAALQANQF